MGEMLRMCLNWKVIAGLALVGMGVWVVAPNLLIGTLPFLALAACPLSMMFMVRGMSEHQGSREEANSGNRRVPPSPEIGDRELQAERKSIDQ